MTTATQTAQKIIRNEIRVIEADLQDPRFFGPGRLAAMQLLAAKVAQLGSTMGLRP